MADKDTDKKKAESVPSPKTNEKNDNYVYFMIPYEKSKTFKIYISEEYRDYENLETIGEKKVDESKFDLIVKVFRFKNLIKEKNKELKIPVIIEEENSAKHKFIISFKYIERDHYEYNFKLEQIDVLPLDYEKQFEIYLDILRDKYGIKQNMKENEDFIFVSQNLIKGDKKFNFLFYLNIFVESYKTNLVRRKVKENNKFT